MEKNTEPDRPVFGLDISDTNRSMNTELTDSSSDENKTSNNDEHHVNTKTHSKSKDDNHVPTMIRRSGNDIDAIKMVNQFKDGHNISKLINKLDVERSKSGSNSPVKINRLEIDAPRTTSQSPHDNFSLNTGNRLSHDNLSGNAGNRLSHDTSSVNSDNQVNNDSPKLNNDSISPYLSNRSGSDMNLRRRILWSQRAQSNTRLAICGSRILTDYAVFVDAMTGWFHLYGDPSLIITGGSKGVDQLAEKYAKENNIPLQVIKSNWSQRNDDKFSMNNEIIKDATHLLIIASLDEKGTQDAIKLAEKKDIDIMTKHNRKIIFQ